MSQTPLQSAKFLKNFTCLGDRCEDTCCKGWGMQLDRVHRNLYQEHAPELLDAVSENGEAELIMKRDPQTDYCVKYDNGLCGIHKEYGETYLGDACYFYPRVTRLMGDHAVMTATLSCPEVARLTLLADDNPFITETMEIERLPEMVADYQIEGLSSDAATKTAEHFIQAADDKNATPERIVMRLATSARSLESMEINQWHEASAFLLRSADMRLLPPEENIADPYRLLHALFVLIGASKQTNRPRLAAVITRMKEALNVTLDPETLDIRNNVEDLSAYTILRDGYTDEIQTALAPILRRWIQAQLSLAHFPFAGFGNTLTERASIIAIRFATIRLALMCHIEDDKAPDDATVITVIQSLARFLDHLADPTLSLSLYKDAGWMNEKRLRGLLHDM